MGSTREVGSRPRRTFPLFFTISLALPLAGSVPASRAAGRLDRSREVFARLHGTGEATPTPPPPSLGEPLDPAFTGRDPAVKEVATADWRRRIRQRRGRASLVPMGPLDPARELLILVPGNGMNFQDTHALVALADTYQILIAISDHRRPITDNGAHLADALVEVVAYRDRLRDSMGLGPDRRLRVVGHSFGGVTAPMMFRELIRRGLLHDGPGSLFDRILFVGMDAPWRGIDLPWPMTIPGIKHLGARILARVFPSRANRGNLSLVNQTWAMRQLHEIVYPDCIQVEYVTVLGHQDTSPKYRHFEPIANWYSAELGNGELERLREFYRAGARDDDRRRLASWGALLTRRQGLAHLVVSLARERDYRAHAASLVEAARRSTTALAFAADYDAILGRIVDTFEGQHTRFMWEDSRFMPWIREKLR